MDALLGSSNCGKDAILVPVDDMMEAVDQTKKDEQRGKLKIMLF
jgi:ABC-type phosphate transport system ATPase subunit